MTRQQNQALVLCIFKVQENSIETNATPRISKPAFLFAHHSFGDINKSYWEEIFKILMKLRERKILSGWPKSSFRFAMLQKNPN